MKHQISRAMAVVALVVAFAAVSASAASARFDLNPPAYKQDSQTAAPAPVAPAGSTSSSSSFDWGDAAVGAGVTLALVALAGGVVVVSRRGQVRSRPATTS